MSFENGQQPFRDGVLFVPGNNIPPDAENPFLGSNRMWRYFEFSCPRLCRQEVPAIVRQSLSANAQIRDFTEFTPAAVGDEDDPNIGEAAYTELVEYVRVGAPLLYMEMHPRPTLDPAQSSQLH